MRRNLPSSGFSRAGVWAPLCPVLRGQTRKSTSSQDEVCGLGNRLELRRQVLVGMPLAGALSHRQLLALDIRLEA